VSISSNFLFLINKPKHTAGNAHYTVLKAVSLVSVHQSCRTLLFSQNDTARLMKYSYQWVCIVA